MDRPDLFSLIREAGDAAGIRGLFTTLGYQPASRPAPDGWHVVAGWRGYEVLARTGGDPRTAVRALARARAGSATPALAAAASASHLVIGASPVGAAAPRVLTISRSTRDVAALQVVRELAPRPDDHALALALRVTERLGSEAAGERFYTAFRAALDGMVYALPVRTPSADATLCALLPLVRVLFLYFVQARGWLDGRPGFLREELDAALADGRPFHTGVLNPLFFGTLNCPPARRTSAFGRIPYLNGGLFEPHPSERRLGSPVFDNARWRDAFDTLFERFRFSAREADEAEAIAPDMLGRVFERVMQHGERHQSGTFYTPAPLVREVVRTTVITALDGTPGADRDALRRLCGGEAAGIRDTAAVLGRLERLRVLDPAVGSGAFLLGALETLTTMRAALAPRENAQAIRRDVLRRNLFGVDRNPVAVRLAELRLWLALISDDPTRDISRVAPLPNLDGIVRQGDSLLDPVSASRALRLPLGVPRAEARAVHEARESVFESRGASRRRAEEALRHAEHALASSMLLRAERSVRAALHDLVSLARGRDLFGRRAGFTTAQARRRDSLKRRLRDLRAARRRLTDGEVPFFAFEVHRPDVMRRGGFDIVVGNPPWVRAERITRADRRTLRERFEWWRADTGPGGFSHLPDLAVAFLERAFELVVDGGAVGMLIPSKVVSAGYGARTRAALVRESRIACLYRVPERDAAAFGATTYPLVLIARKRAPEQGHRVLLSRDGRRHVRQTALGGGGPWVLLPDREHAALRVFLEAGRPLATVLSPGLGVKTGADRIFVGTVVGRKGRRLVVRFGAGEAEIEAHLLRPAVRGRDVRPFRTDAECVLLTGYRPDGTLRNSLPRAARSWIETHVPVLTGRADFVDGPAWTLFRLRGALATHRVVWADIARRPRAAVLPAPGPRGPIPLNTCYVAEAATRSEALITCAVLNSTWAAAYVGVSADAARGGYRRVNARTAGRIPLPHPGPGASALARLARRFHTSGQPDQDALDDAVADALGLSARVRRALRRVAGHPG